MGMGLKMGIRSARSLVLHYVCKNIAVNTKCKSKYLSWAMISFLEFRLATCLSYTISVFHVN